jgi:hypothetical protein
MEQHELLLYVVDCFEKLTVNEIWEEIQKKI